MRSLPIILSLLLPMAATAVLAQDAAPTEPPPADAVPAEPAPADPAPMDAAPMEAAPEEAPPVDVPETVMQSQEVKDLLGSWIIGATARSPEGEDIGPIRDLLIDKDTGTITGAVLGVGGFLGIGAKAIAVDWAELQIDYDGNEVTIALTREQAEAAPEFQFREQEAPPPPPDTGLDPAPTTM
jgi:sporulation protein YlmC with PRC-barrel domain